MSFNFNSLSTIDAVSTSKPLLKPWGIYDVTFEGVTKAEFAGKADPSQNFKVLRVRFSNDDGYYEETIFYPKDNDDVRPEYTNSDGHTYQGASSFERTMTLIAQIATVLNPEGFKKIQENSTKFSSFDNLADAFIKITDPKKGTQVQIKLVGGTRAGQVVAKAPILCRISSKTGNLYTCNNFIGKKLFMTAYEEGESNKYHNAKPTDMEKTVDEADSNFDLDSLL